MENIQFRETLSRTEFEHFISEFEAFRETYFDDVSRLRQGLELLQEEIEELKRQLKKEPTISSDQGTLM
ncbi:hypothetical protein KY325_00930 [Candidatus Woesearchaeota archaeon]|nr:hypothetical protein [Candidatus Woesearchaeota archaeon]MBW3017703.1 hypothetical protein [Candidatus Woesearchaeota archaeon]